MTCSVVNQTSPAISIQDPNNEDKSLHSEKPKITEEVTLVTPSDAYKPNYIDYYHINGAPNRIDTKFKEWQSTRDINRLLTDTELFGALCANFLWSSPTEILTSEVPRHDIERMRCNLAKNILATQKEDFKIYLIPIVGNRVFLKNQPENGVFEIDMNDKDANIWAIKKFTEKCIDTDKPENPSIMEYICELADLNFKITDETHSVSINTNGPESKSTNMKVWNFEWKDHANHTEKLLGLLKV